MSLHSSPKRKKQTKLLRQFAQKKVLNYACVGSTDSGQPTSALHHEEAPSTVPPFAQVYQSFPRSPAFASFQVRDGLGTSKFTHFGLWSGGLGALCYGGSGERQVARSLGGGC